MNPRLCLLLVLLCLPLSPALARPATPIGDLMAGEFALQQGDLAAAGRYYLLAAQVSDDPALAERATRIALMAEQPALARRALARWRQLAPDALPMHAAATLLALSQGEHESAMEEARALLALPDGAGYAVLLGVLSDARGDDAVIARSVMRELFEQKLLPSSLSAWLQLAGLARRLEDEAFSRRVIAAGTDAFPDDPRARLLQAAALREKGDVDGARALLAPLRALASLPPELRPVLAGELALAGEPAQAAAVLARGPQDDASFGQRARWLVQAADQAGLQALYAEVQRAAGTPRPARRLLLGHLAEALSRWDEAERWYGRVTRGTGHDVAMLRRARVLARLERLPEARDVLHELQADRAIDGEQVRDSYVLESGLVGAAGDDAEALAIVQRGLAVFEDDPVLLYARAMLHERGDRVAEALADLRRIIDDNPEDAQALNAYGYTLSSRRGRFAEALPYIERAHALEPESPAILDSLGWAHFRLGRHERGLVFLQQAWAKQKDPEIAAHLGEALWAAGRKDEAKTVWQQGQALDADNEALKRAMQVLP